MWVSKVNELIGSSPEGFEAAASEVVVRANRTLRGITGIEVLDRSIKVRDSQIVEYRVRLRLLFDLAPETMQQL
jgi:flavin-binding protein dodecin